MLALLVVALPSLGCTHECEAEPGSPQPAMSEAGVPTAAGGFVCTDQGRGDPGAIASQRVYHPGLSADEVDLEYRALMLTAGWQGCTYGDLCFRKGDKTLELRLSEMPMRLIQGVDLADRTFVTMTLSDAEPTG